MKTLHPEIEAIVGMPPTYVFERADAVRAVIAREQLIQFGSCNVLSIDAWRASDGGWEWNDWRRVGRFPLRLVNESARTVLAELRARGILSHYSAGHVGMHDDGYNLEIYSRSNGEPLFAIEYGAALQ